MPSGYEKSPDYGGPPPTWRSGVLSVVLVAGAVGVVLGWMVSGGSSEIIGKADRIPDGDTFWVCKGKDCVKIRLCGIDAPEKDQPGSDEAKAALTALIGGATVRCIPVGKGSICDGRSKPKSGDRTVAQCFLGETDIAGEMVRQGHACDWKKFSGGHYGQIEGACQK